MFFLKSIYYFCLEHLEPFLDSFSSRVCFFCRHSLGSLICKECIEQELSLKKKSIDYKLLDHFFLEQEQVFHPKVFYLFNFFKKTSYLIKKAKYTRPYFAKFFAIILSDLLITKLNTILNDDLSEDFISNFPCSKQKLNVFISYTPMHRLKTIERSFNFAELLSKYLFLELQIRFQDDMELLFQGSSGIMRYQLGKVEYLQDFFLRIKNTRPLFNLRQKSRMKELEGAFVVNKEVNIKESGLNILLIIDDICTTGSTLMELMKLCRQESVFEDQIGLSIYGRNLN